MTPSQPLHARAPSCCAPARSQEGWLLKQSGGKEGKKTLGNLVSKWDKRWFSIQGGSSTLCYHKTERDAERGKTPSGEINCDGAMIERVLGGVNPSEGWEVQFALHVEGRVLTLTLHARTARTRCGCGPPR